MDRWYPQPRGVRLAVTARLQHPDNARNWYRFSLADGTSAEAVAIKVGRIFRIEKLLPLEGKKL